MNDINKAIADMLANMSVDDKRALDEAWKSATDRKSLPLPLFFYKLANLNLPRFVFAHPKQSIEQILASWPDTLAELIVSTILQHGPPEGGTSADRLRELAAAVPLPSTGSLRNGHRYVVVSYPSFVVAGPNRPVGIGGPYFSVITHTDDATAFRYFLLVEGLSSPDARIREVRSSGDNQNLGQGPAIGLSALLPLVNTLTQSTVGAENRLTWAIPAVRPPASVGGKGCLLVITSFIIPSVLAWLLR